MGWTNPEDEKDLDKKCFYCGKPCRNTYCDKNCEQADLND
jgi:hypothetical protein